jgi:hypothetical protein
MKRGRLPLNHTVRLRARSPSQTARASGPELVPRSFSSPLNNTAFESLAGFTTTREIEERLRRRQAVRAALIKHGLLAPGDDPT